VCDHCLDRAASRRLDGRLAKFDLSIWFFLSSWPLASERAPGGPHLWPLASERAPGGPHLWPLASERAPGGPHLSTRIDFWFSLVRSDLVVVTTVLTKIFVRSLFAHAWPTGSRGQAIVTYYRPGDNLSNCNIFMY
jgi:hypothetical protein